MKSLLQKKTNNQESVSLRCFRETIKIVKAKEKNLLQHSSSGQFVVQKWIFIVDSQRNSLCRVRGFEKWIQVHVDPRSTTLATRSHHYIHLFASDWMCWAPRTAKQNMCCDVRRRMMWIRQSKAMHSRWCAIDLISETACGCGCVCVCTACDVIHSNTHRFVSKSTIGASQYARLTA